MPRALARQKIAARYRRELEGLGESYARALKHDVTPLVKALERAGQRPLIIVGSGGSYSVATYCSGLHRQATGQISRAMTPLQLAGEGRCLDAGLLCVSASGSNVDIKAAFSAGAEREMRPAIAFALQEGSPIAKLAAGYGYPDACTGPRPAVEDGFLAVNSVLVTCVVFARAYRELAGRAGGLAATYKEFLERTCAQPNAMSDQVAALEGKRTLSVMFSPALEAAAVDLESRFVEAALGHLHIADYRNFGHGRHNWFDKHGDMTAVLSLAQEHYSSLADRTLKLLPDEAVRIKALLSGEMDEVGLAGLVVALHVAAGAGEAIGVDPGRPGVPEFGRKLYRLPPPGFRAEISPVLARKRKAIQIRGGSIAVADLERARDHNLALIENAKIAAVVLDYDGTLVDMRRRYEGLPGEAGAALKELVAKGLSVGIATGRGKSVGKSLREALPKSMWQRVWIGYYNGAECVRLSDEKAPDGRVPSDVSREVCEALMGEEDRWEIDARRLQVTVTPKRCARTPDLLAEVAARIARVNGVHGIVTSSHSLDILCGDFSKLALVEELSRDAGIDPDAVLRIGDRGAAPGNDYDLLRHPLGLSVDEVSADLYSCWRWTPGGCLGLRASLAIMGVLRVSNGTARLALKDLMAG